MLFSISGAFSNAVAIFVNGPVAIIVTGSWTDSNTFTVKSSPGSATKGVVMVSF